jgi:hypothetical protein
MQGQMHIVLAGVRRLVDVREQPPHGAHLRSGQRRIRIEFEVDNTDHMAMGRDLHLALDDRVLHDDDGTGWQAVGMSSTLSGPDCTVRRFSVELVEVADNRDPASVTT